MTNTDRQVIARRGELLAELFLQDLKPDFIAQSTPEIGYDFLMGFSNPRGGINNIPVEVKTTDHPPRGHFIIPKKQYDQFTHSNIPVLLLVADVKANTFYYAWLSPDIAESDVLDNKVRIRVTEIDDKSKGELLNRLKA